MHLVGPSPTDVPISWDNDSTGGAFDTADLFAADGSAAERRRLTAPIAGIYQVTLNLELQEECHNGSDAAAARAVVSATIRGPEADPVAEQEVPCGSTSDAELSVSTALSLAAGESVSARTDITGGNEGTGLEDEANSAFSMVWIGPA
ncbi:MAG: hypothetical protein ACR2N5_01300 [Solirubrobacterales bacterium]